MQTFYRSRYRFYHSGAPKKLLLLSDLHFSRQVSDDFFTALLDFAKREAPDYILFAGDLVDSIDDVALPANRRRLLRWLAKLGEIAPFCIALGNHDFYKLNPAYRPFSRQSHWLADRDPEFLQTITELPNIHLLDNDKFHDKHLYICGITQPPAYFDFSHTGRKATLFHPGQENIDILHDELAAQNQLLHKLPKSAFKIALIHSPVFLDDPDIAAKFEEFDLIVSGHLHNGVVPPFVNELWRSDRGFMAPGNATFPAHARAGLSGKSLNCGALTNIGACANPLIRPLAGAFAPFVATVELSRNQIYRRKPDIQHKYIEW